MASGTAQQNSYLAAMLKLPSNQTDRIIESLLPRAHANAFWTQRTRTDGRLFAQARPTSVVTSILQHSLGSALIKMGNTKIMVANTAEIGQPSPSAPDHGDVMVQVHTKHKKEASNTVLSYLQSYLQRQLSEFLPPHLNLLTGRAAIRLVVTVMVLQDDGNLVDASLLACMAAWKDTRLPKVGVELEEQAGKLWWKQDPTELWRQRQRQRGTQPATLDGSDMVTSSDSPSSSSSSSKTECRISLTMGITQLDGKTTFLVDPTKAEMDLAEGSITISTHIPSRLTQIEFSSPICLDADDLALASKMAEGRTDELLELLSP